MASPVVFILANSEPVSEIQHKEHTMSPLSYRILKLAVNGEGVGTETIQFKFDQICGFSPRKVEYCRNMEEPTIGTIYVVRNSSLVGDVGSPRNFKYPVSEHVQSGLREAGRSQHINWTKLQFANLSVNCRIGIHVLRTKRS